MLRTTIKGLLAHKLRMALTALSIVLGVGFVAGTYMLTDTMNKTFDDLFAGISEGVDVYVRSESSFEAQLGGSRKPIPEALLEEVQAVEGVEIAAGSVSGYAQLVDKKGEAIAPTGPPTLGANWGPEGLSSAVELRSGRAPQGPSDVVIDAATAEKHGFRVSDEVEVLFIGGNRRFEITGIVGFGEADNLAGATLAVFDTATAQEVLDRQGRFDEIEVAGDGSVTPSELRTNISDVLPPGVEAESAGNVAAEQASAIQEGLSFFNIALLVFAGVALFVGAFIIHNTFSITVAQRTKEFALLRALGASGGQVMASVLIEALIVGVIASAVGLGVGALTAMGLQALLSAFGIDLPSTGLTLLPRTVVVALTLGTVVSVVSSLLPARRAARTSPMQALRESTQEPTGFSTKRAVGGGVITAVGAAILFFGLFGSGSNKASVVGFGAFATFLGVAALAPLITRPLAAAIGAPMARLLGISGRLARANAARNPKRTAASASALMIGLALVSLVGIFAASLKATTDQVLEESLKADFLVTGPSTAGPSPMSPQIAADIRERDEFSAVAPTRLGQWRRNSSQLLYLLATDPATFGEVATLGETRGRLRDLEQGGVFLYDQTAEGLGLDVGDSLEMEFAASGTQDLPVAGTFSDKTLVGADYLISLSEWNEHFSERTDYQVLVKSAPGVSAADARAALDHVVESSPNVTIQDQSDIRERSSAQVDQLLGLVTALLGLAIIIALLGITNSLVLAVFERTRELGLLRAVGMSRRQARSMIRWEAVIVAVIGAVLGLVIGVFFGWALVTALKDEGVSRLALPTGQLIAYVVVAGAAGVIAAIPPARRAARLNVLDAISGP